LTNVNIHNEDIETIDDVLRALDDVIAHGLAGRHRWTVFAALYKRMTLAVKRAIDRGEFDDGPRMSWFDAVFARRYFAPLMGYIRGEPVPRAWQVAFEATAQGDHTALQLLLLGVNAHINLDLGFSVVEAGLEPEPFHADFDRINAILAEELDRVQGVLDDVSPWLACIDRVMGRADERLGVFVLVRARAQAWTVATTAATKTAEERTAYEAEVDGKAARLGARIAAPGPVLGMLVKMIRWRESWTVGHLVERFEALPT
jgi:hypothetical protein